MDQKLISQGHQRLLLFARSVFFACLKLFGAHRRVLRRAEIDANPLLLAEQPNPVRDRARSIAELRRRTGGLLPATR